MHESTRRTLQVTSDSKFRWGWVIGVTTMGFVLQIYEVFFQ